MIGSLSKADDVGGTLKRLIDYIREIRAKKKLVAQLRKQNIGKPV